MKNDGMVERQFREIEERAERRLLLDSEKRSEYIMLQKKRKYVEDYSMQLRKELHMYG